MSTKTVTFYETGEHFAALLHTVFDSENAQNFRFSAQDVAEEIPLTCLMKSTTYAQVARLFPNQDRYSITKDAFVNQTMALESSINLYLEKIGFSVELGNDSKYTTYGNGGMVPIHIDRYSNGHHEGQMTIIVYLSEYEGGRTYFNRGAEKIYVDAKIGDVLLFEGSNIKHGCEKVIGEKHIFVTSTSAKHLVTKSMD
jgi:hypothetical protein